MTEKLRTCPHCGQARQLTSDPFDYTVAAGLDPKRYTILLYGIEVYRCACRVVPKIPAVDALHATLVHMLLGREAPLDASAFRFIRQTLGMTQAEFAELVDVTPVTVSKWENKGPWPEFANETSVRVCVLSTLLERPEFEDTFDKGDVRALVKALRARMNAETDEELHTLDLTTIGDAWRKCSPGDGLLNQ